ncbi:X-ray repair cross-complementing protein 6-like [Physella acuta]|uniref:X-ray repair cross-complementing protein 6-like n=1 Tax=Physella acuta TaxID=109671 RepID=UPI0027DDF21C|nr:X-ray repair cross-complementing protein 6-like [Physella acuta]
MGLLNCHLSTSVREHKIKMSTPVLHDNQVGSCLFCRIAHNQEPNSRLLYDKNDIVVFKDIRPASEHHFLVVPKNHVKDPKQLGPKDISLVENLVTVGKEMLNEVGADLSDVQLPMADWGYAQYGDDEENEDEDEELGPQFGFTQKDGLIFLIDSSKSMFEGNCLFQLCLQAVKSTIQNKIISSEKDLIGTVFFGTEKGANPNDFKHIYVFQGLEQPGAKRILELEKLEQSCAETFTKDFGHSEHFSLSDAFWTCLNMFSSADGAQSMGSKRILLFTNNDDPHATNTKLKNLAETKAYDLKSNNIDLELIHLTNGDERFDVNKFYKKLLFSDDDETTQLPDASVKIEELLQRVRAKDHKKRVQRRVSFSIGEGLHLSVGVYNLVRSCPKPYPVKLTKRENAELKSHTKTYLKDTGEVLMPQDLKKAQTYGGRKICFENDEVSEMKQFEDPGLYLVGFKPITSLKKYFHVRPGNFIYPDEKKIAGSTTLFTALLKKCLEREMTPICKYIPSRSYPPRFVSLLPQAEEVDENKVQITPPGFHVIYLPFADDFRKVPFEETPKATKEQIAKAKDVVKKLTFKFSSENFDNPVLQKHWRNIEALALERDEPDKFEDLTLPTQTLMDRAGKAITAFKEMVFPADYVPGQKKKPSAAKKPKMENATIDLDMRAEAEAGRLNKLTVPVLKDFVKREKIPATSTLKKDLVAAISQHFGV